MFSNKVKEYKRVRQESDIALAQSKVLLSGLRKNFRKAFQEDLKRRIKRAAKVKFSEFEFGLKKYNQDAPIIYILTVNDARPVDNGWVDEYGFDVSGVVPFSKPWFEEFCREQSEKLGINIQIQNNNK